MKYQLALQRAAVEDIAEAEAYYDSESPGLSVRFRNDVAEALRRMEQNPRLFPFSELPPYRKAALSTFPFCLYYCVVRNRVHIIAMHDAHRDPQALEKSSNASMNLSVGLKEWDLVINALLSGRQALLLRKGGILESDNQFELEHDAFLFYPTFIHQDPRMVKPAHRPAIRTLPEEPQNVELRGYGQAARIFEVPSRPKLEALDDLHLWDAPLLDMRFNYRPEKPLYLVVIRAFILPQPITIPNTLAYAGCKSWVPLNESIDITQAQPVLDEPTLAQLIERITRAFA